MPADDISRLYDFMPNTQIASGQVDDELNLHVTTLNNKASRVVENTFTGNNTFQGSSAFSGAVNISGATTLSNVATLNVDVIEEKTAAAGVTIDGVLAKDGNINVGSAGYTPAADGDFGYDETADVYRVRLNGVNDTLTVLSQVTTLVIGLGFKTGRYYGSPLMTGTTTAPSAGSGINGTDTVAIPFYVPATTSFDRIAISVTTAVGASAVGLGLYNNTNGVPSSLITSGSVSSATTGTKEATISQTLAKGWYWLAVRSSSGSVGLAYATGQPSGHSLLGLDSIIAAATGFGAIYDSASLPANWTYTSSNFLPLSGANIPAIWMRVA
jgi:hypothetical protein